MENEYGHNFEIKTVIIKSIQWIGLIQSVLMSLYIFYSFFLFL